ncbi:diguanylate cyclase [Devosia sp. XJ19-1]|uniref:Diguanylate cyclase n=1 Tax=Devosia ureilytica TaxID=2952754 RepID=A0A9Q4FRQ1_9HYPH|nr:diguanylate cyclase [Devosia ureilytica]MCP8882039.1 diguanylate cyclase [Devosia ureilytica]MCP8886075.1 diguanylate cyclase [Devosia ureilytica]
MYAQTFSNGPFPPELPPEADSLAAGRAFLKRLRDFTGMAGAALVTRDGRPVERDGDQPPSGFDVELLGPSGLVTVTDDAVARFMMVIPIPGIDPHKPHWLLLWAPQARPVADANLLLARVTELVAHAAMARRRAAEVHRQHLIERASATARIGIWACSLPDETLTWSDGVYDLFELPRGSRIDRAQTLKMYTPESAERMQVLRANAIATLGDFNFDAEIITTTGKRRWMRITATVDGSNGRARKIFGMKQNITEEKLLAEQTRRLAETDTLTGLANRSLFQARLDDLHGVGGGAPIGALLLVDLDRFKSINDEMGHAQGDACLIEAGRRLVGSCPPGTLVARIGGDEFAIVTDLHNAADNQALCASIVQAFGAPFTLAGEPRPIGASVGMAVRGRHDADTLYRNADLALYQAKSAGRGTWRQFIAA